MLAALSDAMLHAEFQTLITQMRRYDPVMKDDSHLVLSISVKRGDVTEFDITSEVYLNREAKTKPNRPVVSPALEAAYQALTNERRSLIEQSLRYAVSLHPRPITQTALEVETYFLTRYQTHSHKSKKATALKEDIHTVAAYLVACGEIPIAASS